MCKTTPIFYFFFDNLGLNSARLLGWRSHLTHFDVPSFGFFSALPRVFFAPLLQLNLRLHRDWMLRVSMLCYKMNNTTAEMARDKQTKCIWGLIESKFVVKPQGYYCFAESDARGQPDLAVLAGSARGTFHVVKLQVKKNCKAFTAFTACVTFRMKRMILNKTTEKGYKFTPDEF